MMTPTKETALKALLSGLLTLFTGRFGALSWALSLWMLSMALDYVTGSCAAKARGEWSSKKAREGLWHKLGEIASVLVAALSDLALKTVAAEALSLPLQTGGTLTLMVSLWYLFTELGSIMENAQSLGAPVPDWLTKGVGKAKELSEDAGKRT